MGVTLLWKLVTSSAEAAPDAHCASDTNQRELAGRTVVVDGGWMHYWTAPFMYALPRDHGERVSVANLANLWRCDYATQHAATQAWLTKFADTGAARVVVALDGSFAIEKTEESLLRSRSRVAEALETERRIVERDDGAYLHKKFAREGHLTRMVGTQMLASLRAAPAGGVVVSPVVAEGESDMLSIALYRRHNAAALWGNDSDYLLMLPAAGSDTALVRTTATLTTDVSIAGAVPAGSDWRLSTYSVQRVHSTLLSRLHTDAVTYLRKRDSAVTSRCERVVLTPHVLIEAALLAGNDWLEHFYDRASLAGALGMTIQDILELADVYDVCPAYARGSCKRATCDKKHPPVVAAGAPLCFRWAVIHALQWGAAHGGSTAGWTFDMCPGMDIVKDRVRAAGQMDAFHAAITYARCVYSGDASFYSSLRVLVDPARLLGDPYSTVAADGDTPGASAPAAAGSVLTSSAHEAFAALCARVRSDYPDAGSSDGIAPLRVAALRQHVLRMCDLGAPVHLYSFLHSAAVEQSVALDWVPRWCTVSPRGPQGVGMCRTFAVAGLAAAAGALLRMRHIRLDIPALAGVTAMDTHAKMARGGVYHKADAPIEGADVILKLDASIVVACPRVQLVSAASDLHASADADAMNLAEARIPFATRWAVLLALLACAASPTATGVQVPKRSVAARAAPAPRKAGRFAALDDDDDDDDDDGDREEQSRVAAAGAAAWPAAVAAEPSIVRIDVSSWTVTTNAITKTNSTAVAPVASLPNLTLVVHVLAVSHLTRHSLAHSEAWASLGLHYVDEAARPMACGMNNVWLGIARYALLAQSLLLQVCGDDTSAAHGIALALRGEPSQGGRDGDGFEAASDTLQRTAWMHALACATWYEQACSHVLDLLHLLDLRVGDAVPEPRFLLHHRLYVCILEHAGFFTDAHAACEHGASLVRRTLEVALTRVRRPVVDGAIVAASLKQFDDAVAGWA